MAVVARCVKEPVLINRERAEAVLAVRVLMDHAWPLNYHLCSRITASLCDPGAAAQPNIGHGPEKSRLMGQFLHITDIHPDEHYINSGTISSSCHRNITDGEDGEDKGAIRPGRIDGGTGGFYGAPYSICDSPFSLANATHDSDNAHPRTQKEIEDLNRVIANMFLATFTPDKDDPFQQRIPIVPSIGNNDVYPHNIMEAGPNRILQHFSEIWSEFIPESQYHTFQHGGYYASEVVIGKITVVSLNTLFFFNQNAAVNGCDDADEPGTEQMDWLEVELESLRRRKMTAYLTGHVPPARKSYSPSCYVRYTDISLRYQDVIVGHLFGHANIDHFFLLSQATVTGAEEGNGTLEETRAEATDVAGTNSPSTAQQKSLRLELDDSTEGTATLSPNTKGHRTWDLQDDNQDHEYDPFHFLGLNSYLVELWSQYESIPEHPKLSDYAIVFVSPSVIPTYNPTLRVYTYQLVVEQNMLSEAMAIEGEVPETQDGDMEALAEEENEQAEGYDMEGNDLDGKKKKKKKPRKPRKPRRPNNPPAAPPITFGFPLNYTQYWVNLTHANMEPAELPKYEVEYRTREDYGLKDLGVKHWLDLARKIVKDDKLRDQYLAWMVVLTGTENDHF
ncbi:Endopolyphosphatase [Mortierella sp. GBA30]|nr:Endopolyphosphatase [Mortierella sp. GBA30]